MSPRSAVFVLAGIALAVMVLSSSLFDPQTVLAQANNKVTGYAWSSTIGWIKLDHTKTNSVILDSNKQFVGYGWSPNVGWVQFSPALKGPNGTGFGVKVDQSASPVTVSGWARVCGGMVSGGSKTTDPNNVCNGADRSDGWDGWIHFDHNKVNYRVKADSTGKLSGYAWGANIVGWLNMARVTVPLDQVIENIILTVSKSGGNGNVTSNPAGINCGSTCSSPYAKDVDVVLTASVEPTSWTGCDTVSANKLTCNVKMTSSRSVSVVFPDNTGCNTPGGCTNPGLAVTCAVNGSQTDIQMQKSAIVPVTWAATPSGASNYTYIWGGQITGSGSSVTFTPTAVGTYTETIKVTSGSDSSPVVTCPKVTVVDDVAPDYTPEFSVSGLSAGPSVLIDCEHLINCANLGNIQSSLLTLTNKKARPIVISFAVQDTSLFYVVNDLGQEITTIDLAGNSTAKVRVKMYQRVRGTEKTDQLTITGSDKEFPTYTTTKPTIKIRYLDRTQTPQ